MTLTSLSLSVPIYQMETERPLEVRRVKQLTQWFRAGKALATVTPLPLLFSSVRNVTVTSTVGGLPQHMAPNPYPLPGGSTPACPLIGGQSSSGGKKGDYPGPWLPKGGAPPSMP